MAEWLRRLRGTLTRWQNGAKESPDEAAPLTVDVGEIPKQSLIVRLQHARSKCWRMATRDGKPAMQILADFYLTNTTREHEIFITQAFFVFYPNPWWFPFSRRVEGQVLVKNRFAAKGIAGKYGIPPCATFEGFAEWWVQPPVKNEGQNLTGRVCFVDQFENEHWTAVSKWKCR